MTAPRLRILSVEVRERMMPFVRPFRFGPSVVEAAPQAFVRIELEVEGAGRAVGQSAEMMMPRWFDKAPHKSPEQTVDDLRRVLLHAAALYADAPWSTAYGLSADAAAMQLGWAEGRGIPALAAHFGPALLDKAVVDALLRALSLTFPEGLSRNVMGLDARNARDLSADQISALLASLAPVPAVAVRHTIGLLDPLEGPHGLSAEIAAARLRFFKIKIGGDLAADFDRLAAITALLTHLAPDFRATLDANEQYDPERLCQLAAGLDTPALRPLKARLLYIEQPFDRAETFTRPLPPALDGIPVIIDEADGGLDAFPRAIALGYRGVSSKTCKGLYKSILNAVRVRAGQGTFLTAEDLTCQPGLGLQQDLALVATLGLTHGERNGHHYVAGFGPAPEEEAGAFAAAHPDLYRLTDKGAALDVSRGVLATAALLSAPGFAKRAEPGWASLAPVTLPETRLHQEIPA